MRCDEVRERLDGLWEGEQPIEVRQHVAQCASCEGYYRDLRWVCAGLRLLKAEEAPQPSLGFAERLVRQLEEMTRQTNVADFFEQVGRRFVYATLVLTFLTLLAVVLPSTGPVRGLGTADFPVSAQEASLGYSDPMGESGLQEAPDLAPVESVLPAIPTQNEVK
jgi:predicted anti-sigma-YlaC factor YlaD